MRLFRYELSFDGERQHVGIFDGIGEVFSSDIEESLMNTFVKLIYPANPQKQGVFFFTEKGNTIAEPVIRDAYAASISSDILWGVIFTEIEISDVEIVYEDDVQVAIALSDALPILEHTHWSQI